MVVKLCHKLFVNGKFPLTVNIAIMDDGEEKIKFHNWIEWKKSSRKSHKQNEWAFEIVNKIL